MYDRLLISGECWRGVLIEHQEASKKSFIKWEQLLSIFIAGY